MNDTQRTAKTPYTGIITPKDSILTMESPTESTIRSGTPATGSTAKWKVNSYL